MRLTNKTHSDNLHKRLEGYRKEMKRTDISASMNPAYESMSYVSHHELVYDKLGQLEDLEEELGIDLITLFKALKNGVYMLTKCFDIVYCKCPKLVHYKCGWKMLVYGATLSLTTYGKTWALTRGELL